MNELNICVVDDDPYFNQLVTQMIRNNNSTDQQVEVYSYYSGYDCLHGVENPDLVFLDFYLSSTNDITQTGLDTLKQLKHRNPATKIIFMSKVHDWSQFKNELIAEGAIDFIKKDEQMAENINRIIQMCQK